jgi:16S rRNA (guanine527-N7)-methyltransferase
MDIGSGGGSPAIPLKLCAPAASLTMVEAKARKSAFLREAIRALRLDRSSVETARYEELLARPELHDRCVDTSIAGRTLLTLQAFVRPGGLVFLFRVKASDSPRCRSSPPLDRNVSVD